MGARRVAEGGEIEWIGGIGLQGSFREAEGGNKKRSRAIRKYRLYHCRFFLSELTHKS
jgi:hypothetical protein